MSRRAAPRFVRMAYDFTAPLYPLSSKYFHSRAHSRLLELAGEIAGSSVLEVATGSGELFARLVAANPTGLTAGVDLSPAMVAAVRRNLNGASRNGGVQMLQACDARLLPFRDATFDTVIACYLFELLPESALDAAAAEFRRVLRPDGCLLMTNVSQSRVGFNMLYRLGSFAAPMFWGRQVSRRIPEILERQGFRVLSRETLRQSGYPTDITVARCGASHCPTS